MRLLIGTFLAFAQTAASLSTPSNLQAQHASLAPAEALQQLIDSCKDLNISSFDVYGDFHLDESKSFLRRFESELAEEFGKEDAVFMPSGVMAQDIALLIHGGKQRKKTHFACHHSSHLLLHEEEAYRELVGLEPLVIDTTGKVGKNGYSIPAMGLEDATKAFDGFKDKMGVSIVGESLSTLILELPHRELGGKCTSWDEILGMRQLCDEEGVMFHCDGARIFEATCYYEDKTLSEIADQFDSLYISFYKGLGGISGAMLMGNADFCGEARKWLRRFGGNLYTLLPYAVSGWAGYHRHWVNVEDNMSFVEKYFKLTELMTEISKLEAVSFDPEVPCVNMVHGYFRHTVDEVISACDRVEEATGKRVLNRVGPIAEDDNAYKVGYRSKFEWTIGASNGAASNQDILNAWRVLVSELEIEE